MRVFFFVAGYFGYLSFLYWDAAMSHCLRIQNNGAFLFVVDNVGNRFLFFQPIWSIGGKRTWFLCPHCNRRVALLYGAGKYFLCRHCYNLTYASQQIQRYERLMEKARGIRQRLGGSANLSEPFPEKPKGMHRKTYYQLRQKAGQANHSSLVLAAQQFGYDWL